MLSSRLQLADVIVYYGASTLAMAVELAAATLAELTGCALAAVEVTDQCILLMARHDQCVVTSPGDVLQVAVETYKLLLRGNGVLASRSWISASFGSPLVE
jgi:hypothetical protein